MESIQNCEDIPEDIRMAAEQASTPLLPAKSRSRYDKAHADFVEWRHKQKVKSVNEQVILTYVQELSKSFAPSSLWTIVSMLKASLQIKEKIDISQYRQVRALLKRKSEGYNPKKSKILNGNQITQFLLQAPDEIHLLTKVILIFGIYGLCRRDELAFLSIDDLEDTGKHVIIVRRDTKNHTSRRFVITDEDCEFRPYSLYRKYAALRPANLESKRFFLCYRNGKCTSQNVGVHSVGSVPCKIATYLGLETPHQYTGHSFRRSSATLMADNGASKLTFKRGWKPAAVTESYIEDSAEEHLTVEEQLFQGFMAEPSMQLIQGDITSEFNVCDENAVKTESDEIDIEDEVSEDCVDLDPPLEKKKKNNVDPLNEEISLHSMHDVQFQQRTDEAFTMVERDSQKEDNKRDECDIYAELVATKLRKMDERTRDIAMNKIDNLLFDLKVNPPCQHQYTRQVHSCQTISTTSPSFCHTSSMSHRTSSPHRQPPSP